jgi:ABC-2 type transport system permease protein
MSKIWLVAQREITTKMQSVWFWLVPIIIPIGFVLIIGVTTFFAVTSDGSQNTGQIKINVVDQTYQQIYASTLQDNKYLDFQISTVPLQQAKDKVAKEKDSAVLTISTDKNGKNKFQIYSAKNLQQITLSELNTQLNVIELAKFNLPQETLNTIRQGVNVENIVITEQKTEQANLSNVVFGISYAIAFLIYMVSTIFGTVLMMSILEEKSSRVVEVLLSCISPMQLLLGKIMGQVVLIFTQSILTVFFSFVVTTISGFVAASLFLPKMNLGISNTRDIGSIVASPEFKQASEAIGSVISSFQINPNLFIFLVFLYFVMGLMFSAIWFAAIGASSDNYQAASNSSLSWFISLPSIVGLIFLPNIASDPHSFFAKVLSIFPLTSYIIMPARLAFGVNPWEVVLSIVVTLGGIGLSFWVCGKIYRIGLLMYGKNTNLFELWKWVKQS